MLSGFSWRELLACGKCGIASWKLTALISRTVLNGRVKVPALQASKTVSACANFSDQREQAHENRAAARIGLRPGRSVNDRQQNHDNRIMKIAEWLMRATSRSPDRGVRCGVSFRFLLHAADLRFPLVLVAALTETFAASLVVTF